MNPLIHDVAAAIERDATSERADDTTWDYPAWDRWIPSDMRAPTTGSTLRGETIAYELPGVTR